VAPAVETILIALCAAAVFLLAVAILFVFNPLGLGPEPEIVQASVRWPSGASDRLTGLDLDRYHRLIEPEGRR